MRGIVSKFVPAVMLMLLGLMHPTVQAANECKGLGKSSCSANPDCTWVSSYKTKTGSVIKAYCRLKPGKKAPADKSSAKHKTSKKSDQTPTASMTKKGKAENDDIKPAKAQKTKKKAQNKTGNKQKKGNEDKKAKKDKEAVR